MDIINNYKLHFIKGELNTNNVNVLATETIKKKGYVITLGILDTGHFISYSKNGNTILTEAYSYSDIELDNSEDISMAKVSFIKRDFLDYLFKVSHMDISFYERQLPNFDKVSLLTHKTKDIIIQFIVEQQGYTINYSAASSGVF